MNQIKHKVAILLKRRLIRVHTQILLSIVALENQVSPNRKA